MPVNTDQLAQKLECSEHNRGVGLEFGVKTHGVLQAVKPFRAGAKSASKRLLQKCRVDLQLLIDGSAQLWRIARRTPSSRHRGVHTSA
jgi:hypothetical protein